MPHNPAQPDERRTLAVEVLLHGTALHLDVPQSVAHQAEVDARYLACVHGDEEAARRILAPRRRRRG